MNETPILVQAKQQIAASVPKQFKVVYDRIIGSGSKLMWSDQTHAILQKAVAKIQSPEQIPQAVADGITSAILTIIHRAKIPPKMEHPFYAASMPAAQFLACDALEYIGQKKGIPITPDLLASTIKAVVAGMNTLYGITGEVAKQSLAAVQQQQEKMGTLQRQPAQPGQMRG